MAVTAISAKRTIAKTATKTATRTAATARHWKTLIAASSTSPMPPAPDGPMTAVMPLASTSSETPSSTVTPLVNCLERPRIWRGTHDYLILLSPSRVYVSPAAAATSRTTCQSFL